MQCRLYVDRLDLEVAWGGISSSRVFCSETKKYNHFVKELIVYRSRLNLLGALTFSKTRRKKVGQNFLVKNGSFETL